MITAEERTEIITKFRINDTDTGSAQVQIALLTARINAVNEHMKEHKKDFHTQRGLLKLVGRRNRLLRYMRTTNEDGYKTLIKSLGLRK